MANKIQTFSILFYLRKVKTDSEGNTPIYARITVNGVRAEFSVSRSIPKERWDSSGQKVKGNREDARTLNMYLDTVKSNLYNQHKKLIENNKVVTAMALRNAYSGISEKKYSLMEAIKYHNEQAAQKVDIDFAPATILRYNTTQKHVADYLQHNYKVNDIALSELNYKFITGLEHYLKTIRNCNHNSTLKYIRNLRKIVNIALANEWLEKDPFLKFKGTLKEVEREILMPQELKAVEEKQFSIARLQEVKDLFVFCCYTGLAYVDMQNLTPDNIAIGIDGEKWIFTHRQKTDTKTNVPLLAPALEIIKKYENHPEAKITGKIFPVKSNQKLNAYLKEIADLCGISKNLTWHIARHTFATTVALLNDVPMETVKKMLGHKNIRTTEIYGKVLEQKVSSDMGKLKQRLLNKEGNSLSVVKESKATA